VEPINRSRLLAGSRTLEITDRLQAGDVLAVRAGRHPFLLLHRDPF
jgi:hypothetical protein